MTSNGTIAGRLTLRRGLDEAEAAVYLSLTLIAFRQLVAQGLTPPPRLSEHCLLWDVDALEHARPGLLIASLGLRNLDRFVDRHGKPRCYFRSGRGSRVPLPGVPGSPEFMEAYEAAARDLTSKRARRA